jgi:hypothetical protein
MEARISKGLGEEEPDDELREMGGRLACVTTTTRAIGSMSIQC